MSLIETSTQLGQVQDALSTKLATRYPSQTIPVYAGAPAPSPVTPYVLIVEGGERPPIVGFGIRPLLPWKLRVFTVHDTEPLAKALGDAACTAMLSLGLSYVLEADTDGDGYADTPAGVAQWSEGFTLHIR